MSDKKVVTRFAPSPTGFMHVGGVRTALYAYLYAKKNDGKFILRIEDTDKEREVDGAVEQIKQSLRYILQDGDKPNTFPNQEDLALDTNNPWDEFYTQSERLDTYLSWAKKLAESGLAYFDPYTKEELEVFRQKAQDDKKPFLFREHRPAVLDSLWTEEKSRQMPLRFKIQNVEKTEWVDQVRGELQAGPEALDDFIIMKTDGYPTYNFCHVIDDIEMQVTHVMRGEEFIPSTPKFIALYSALQKIYPEKEIAIPNFVTLPPILGETGTKKLSKRDGAKDVLDYHKEGFLPEALANFLAFQGWNPGGEKELYNTRELVKSFSLERIQKSGARWNPVKLDWFNKEYIKITLLSDTLRLKENFFKALPVGLRAKFDDSYLDDSGFNNLFEKYLERISYFGQLSEQPVLDELLILEKTPVTDLELIYTDLDKNETLHILESLSLILNTHAGIWSPESLKGLLSDIIKEKGTKNVLWPLRTTLSGQKKSLDPFSLMSILGKEESVKRIHLVLEMMKK